MEDTNMNVKNTKIYSIDQILGQSQLCKKVNTEQRGKPYLLLLKYAILRDLILKTIKSC